MLLQHKIDENIVLDNYMSVRDILETYEEITIGEQILEDIQKAAKGQTVLSASMNQALAECLREESFSKERRVSELTEREKSVLKLIAQGKTNKEIGKALEISDGTVKVHVKHVLHKLSFRSRVEAAVWAKEQKNL